MPVCHGHPSRAVLRLPIGANGPVNRAGRRNPTVPLVLHLTHVQNLASIRDSGALLADRIAPTSYSIADSAIKHRRMIKRVPCAPGGVVADYVPFYFAPRSPMLYSIVVGNVPNVSAKQQDLVYLVFDADELMRFGLPCVYANGNAASSETEFTTDRRQLSDFIDWELMRAGRWHNTSGDPKRKWRRQAELLVHGRVPLEQLKYFVVRDNAARAHVSARIGGSRVHTIKTKTDWYFPDDT